MLVLEVIMKSGEAKKKKDPAKSKLTRSILAERFKYFEESLNCRSSGQKANKKYYDGDN